MYNTTLSKNEKEFQYSQLEFMNKNVESFDILYSIFIQKKY